jgi:HD-GYP domain-containing protein (c-di-GMP phosphodiesterase class II)
MLDHYRINVSDIAIGEPLPWDVYDESKRLLLSRGHVIATERQFDELTQRALFIDGTAAAGLANKKCGDHSAKQAIPSALRLINSANKRLERLLYNLTNEPDLRGKVLDIARSIAKAVDINPDISLGCVLLNQQAHHYTIRHCLDTAVLTAIVARGMKKGDDEILVMMAAALTMNIGMLRQHDELQERSEPLSEKELENIRQHPQQAANILMQYGIDDPDWLSYVLLHHENDDGSGYPLGKSVGGISTNAKIIALADRYCAAVSNRRYRKPLLPQSALRDVFLGAGKPSDPTLAAYFIREIGNYPPGTFVRLQNGEIGVVTRKGKTATTPVVHALIGPRGAPLAFPIKRDSGKDLYAIREPLSGEQAALRFSLQQLWGDEAAL